MKIVGVRELKNRISKYLNEVESEGAVIVTNHGQPCAALVPLTPEDTEDFILAHSPRIQRMVRKGTKEIESGKHVTLEELLGEFDEEAAR